MYLIWIDGSVDKYQRTEIPQTFTCHSDQLLCYTYRKLLSGDLIRSCRPLYYRVGQMHYVVF